MARLDSLGKTRVFDDASSQAANENARWAAVVTRDRRWAGAFVYAVRSTGIYCRPGCAARRPHRHNVVFFETPAEARAAGFRSCQRCRPDEVRPDAVCERVTAACRLIEAGAEPPTLDALARAVGLSRSHFHRTFTTTLSLTPRSYAAACRARRLRDGLAHAATVTTAIYDAGFNSSGRFYADADAILGMTPKTYRAGGAGIEVRFATGQCSLGAILVAATDKGVCAIALGDDPEALVHDLRDRFPAARLIENDSDFAATLSRVVALVDEPWTPVGLPLDIRGTAFQQRVWEILRAIPPGQTWTYTEVAVALGVPRAARAVARACAANPIAVAIPCHRVVRSDGTPSGYRWGAARKERLQAREAGS